MASTKKRLSIESLFCTQSRGRTGTDCSTGVWDQRVYRFRHLGEQAWTAAHEKSLAERGGFEPPVRLPVRQFSKLLVSATHPSLLGSICRNALSETAVSAFQNAQSGCKGTTIFLYMQISHPPSCKIPHVFLQFAHSTCISSYILPAYHAHREMQKVCNWIGVNMGSYRGQDGVLSWLS